MTSDKLLAEIAGLARQWARSRCHSNADGGHDCSWYHGAWPTLRLIGTISGAKGDESFLQSAFTRQIRTQDQDRILITAAADHAILEQVLIAYRKAGAVPRVTVIDQCDTALDINRWYAEQHGVEIKTERADILGYKCQEPFDLVTTHLILSFIPHSMRSSLLGNWRSLLKTDGHLVTAQAVRLNYEGPLLRSFSEMEIDEFAARVHRDADRAEISINLSKHELTELARHFAANKLAYVINDPVQLRQDICDHQFDIIQFENINRAESGLQSASPDKSENMSTARIVARAI